MGLDKSLHWCRCRVGRFDGVEHPTDVGAENLCIRRVPGSCEIRAQRVFHFFILTRIQLRPHFIATLVQTSER